MVELRWLVRHSWDGPVKVLQYRQQFDSNVYAGDPAGFQFPIKPTMAWSPWKDVVTVEDDNEHT